MWGTLLKAIFETQLSNYALVNLIIKKDSRKLNQWLKLVSLARNIFDFWLKIVNFLVEIDFFQTNSPGIRRRDIIQQLGTNLWIALRRKKLSIPNICTFYRWGSKKKHFQKARAIKRNRQDRLHRNQGMTITSGARVLTWISERENTKEESIHLLSQWISETLALFANDPTFLVTYQLIYIY